MVNLCQDAMGCLQTILGHWPFDRMDSPDQGKSLLKMDEHLKYDPRIFPEPISITCFWPGHSKVFLWFVHGFPMAFQLSHLRLRPTCGWRRARRPSTAFAGSMLRGTGRRCDGCPSGLWMISLGKPWENHGKTMGKWWFNECISGYIWLVLWNMNGLWHIMTFHWVSHILSKSRWMWCAST